MLLDAVRERLQQTLLLNFNTEVVVDVANNREDGGANNNNESDQKFSTAIALLSNTTQQAYERVRKNIMLEFSIKK